MQSNIQDLTNSPIDFPLGNQTFKIQRLNLKEIFGLVETKVKEDYLKNGKELAKELTGKDKIEWLKSLMADIPKGEKLYTECNEYLVSPDGIAMLLKIGLNKYQKVEDQEIADLLRVSNMQEIKNITSYLVGMELTEVTKESEEDKKK